MQTTNLGNFNTITKPEEVTQYSRFYGNQCESRDK